MSKRIPDHIDGLVSYLSNPSEKANEDLIIKYFRKVWGESFTRQREAKNSDGYVQGSFVLELKGKKKDWLSGFFQALAYSKKLDFSQVVVGTKNFLSIWKLSDLDDAWIEEAISMEGAPSAIGKKLSAKYKNSSRKISELANWKLSLDFEGSLLIPSRGSIMKEFNNFEKTLSSGKKVRKKITTKNFGAVLKEMKPFFEQGKPIKTVRAFYNMIFSWDEGAVVELSQKNKTQATISGELIENLIPGKRIQFKKYVESHRIHLENGQDIDDFFALYDKAIDAVDREFRIKNGIFFTDLDLSKFVMWFVKRNLGDIGKNYLVIDPACGSGNLVTNWRSPLELRHKVVSEIEPELLYTVEKRMKGDKWHDGKFTVVPKVTENKGLNFLDKSAEEYLNVINGYLKDRGHSSDKPIAFLCNPPYRSDDDQSAEKISYDVHSSITDVTGRDGGAERYSCFLAQMSNICKQAKESGFPEDSLMILFTKAAWLTKRPVFSKIREDIFSNFEDVGGALVNSKEFFEVKGKFPIAITVWKYLGRNRKLDPTRSIKLDDLTWLKKKDLSKIEWSDVGKYDFQCDQIIKEKKTIKISLGTDISNIKESSGFSMVDFKRGRRKSETNERHVGGLPSNDRRLANKKAYGEVDGPFLGFLDDLTPVRVKKGTDGGSVWFRLNNQFMDCRKTRCFSGPPSHIGYVADDYESSKTAFSWFALGRTFASEGYPMWVDADNMWAVEPAEGQLAEYYRYIYAIGFAENECLEATFPAKNPVKEAKEIKVSNPMTPLDKDSFWNKSIKKNLNLIDDNPSKLIKKVNSLYKAWAQEVGKGNELHVPYERAYFISAGVLTDGAGLIQIKDYAKEMGSQKLEKLWREVLELTKLVKQEFYQKLVSREHLDYFGDKKNNAQRESNIVNVDFTRPKFEPKTNFDKVLEKRLALFSYLVAKLPNDNNLTRVKLAKAFYLCDTLSSVDMQTKYERETAGPLDYRFFYNDKIGINILGPRYQAFSVKESKRVVNNIFHYKESSKTSEFAKLTTSLFKKEIKIFNKIIDLMKEMTPAQSEIFATLFACWNDLLIAKKKFGDEDIINQFRNNWDENKKKHPEKKLKEALKWMRQKKVIPTGTGKKVTQKKRREAIPF